MNDELEDLQADTDLEEQIRVLLFEMHRKGEVAITFDGEGVAHFALAEAV